MRGKGEVKVGEGKGRSGWLVRGKGRSEGW